MFLHEIELQNFRCFDKKVVRFSAPITFITGDNGAGKTSILEAIHYLCYFKSFRSSVVQDVIHAGSDNFFLKGNFERQYDFETAQHTLQLGYCQRKKSVKLNQKAVTSYKQILPFFRVITLTEDDIDLVRGYPSVRRSFVDQAVLFCDHEMYDTYTKFRQVLHQRNALFAAGKSIDGAELEVWDHSLWLQSQLLQKARIQSLKVIEKVVNNLIETYFDGIYEVSLHYDAQLLCLDDDFNSICPKIYALRDQERILKRSLFGAHLDDLRIEIKGKKARNYASRGQQKLVSLLCKVAWTSLVSDGQYERPVMLIDDFISDFDQIRLSQLANFFIASKNQIILTAPFCDNDVLKIFQKADSEMISL
ncbi:DNA replication/repair protein RecF [Candidatus Babeliales bacterium]|nr:DNA replication/repair protein RecF [Candidatus Babeliales bacterium]